MQTKTKFLVVSKWTETRRLFSTAAGAAQSAFALAIDYGYQNGISVDLNKDVEEIEEQIKLGFDVMVGYEYFDRANELMPVDYDYPVMIRPIKIIQQDQAAEA